MEDPRDTLCKHCGKPLAYDSLDEYWMHADTAMVECDPASDSAPVDDRPGILGRIIEQLQTERVAEPQCGRCHGSLTECGHCGETDHALGRLTCKYCKGPLVDCPCVDEEASRSMVQKVSNSIAAFGRSAHRVNAALAGLTAASHTITFEPSGLATSLPAFTTPEDELRRQALRMGPTVIRRDGRPKDGE